MKISLYYTILASISFAMIIFTVFTGSQAVPNGQALRSLEREKEVLVEKEKNLQHQLSQSGSLTAAQELASSRGFSFSHSVVSLSASTQVALR